MRWTGSTMPHELRRTMRVRPKGSIRVHCGSRVVRGRMIDLALGGVSIRTERTSHLRELVGARVGVELRFDTGSPKPFSLHGHILRASTTAKTVVIQFADVPSGFEDCVQDELLAALEHDKAPHVIIVDAVVHRRHTIASSFRRSGCEVIEVSTPLDAIARLGRGRFEPGVIAITDTLPEEVAEDLREFLSGEHPEAHMVAIGRSRRHRARASSWLSSTDPKCDVDVRVGRLVTAHAARHRPRSAATRAREWKERKT